MSMNERVSLRWVLSELSPVVITSSSRRPVSGLRALRTWLTISSSTCGEIPSCGR